MTKPAITKTTTMLATVPPIIAGSLFDFELGDGGTTFKEVASQYFPIKQLENNEIAGL